MFKFFTTAWLSLLVLAGSPGLTIAITEGDINIVMSGFSSDSKYFVMTTLETGDAAGTVKAKIMIVDVDYFFAGCYFVFDHFVHFIFGNNNASTHFSKHAFNNNIKSFLQSLFSLKIKAMRSVIDFWHPVQPCGDAEQNTSF